jgi:hypothetical protein
LEHRLQATVQRSLLIGVLGVAIFWDWRPGVIGLLCALPFCWLYWRPGGPGSRRVERDRDQWPDIE